MLNLIKSIYHFLWAFKSAVFYRFPSRNLFVLGITGTKGKSTTIELVNAILEEAGFKTAFLSSVRYKIADKIKKNNSGNTMPGRFFIQKFLREAVSSGARYALLEVTSQGVLQNRHRFIEYDAVMFLNIHPEHIEAHGSFEKYRDAKVEFFKYAALKSKKSPKYFFINADDENMKYFRDAAESHGQIHFFSPKLSNASTDNFNKENISAAISFAKTQGISDEIIKKALKTWKGIPGRMEFIQKKPFSVIVDYAHTPDSLEKVYQFIKSKLKPNKLICVLGSAGGGRDKWKRPAMGKIAAAYCDTVIITNEDPYDENPEDIIKEMAGILHCERILDRRQAISRAISEARHGDIVIITGKGSENWIHGPSGKLIPWNEIEVVEKILKELKRSREN